MKRRSAEKAGFGGHHGVERIGAVQGGSLEELMKTVLLKEMTMMMMEGEPSSTMIVEYAWPLEYSSVGVPYGHDLIAYGVS